MPLKSTCLNKSNGFDFVSARALGNLTEEKTEGEVFDVYLLFGFCFCCPCLALTKSSSSRCYVELGFRCLWR